MHRNFVAGLTATLACWPIASAAGSDRGASRQSGLRVFSSAEVFRP